MKNPPRNNLLKELMIMSLIIPPLNEVIQIPIPGRKFSLLDIVANFMGFVAVILFIRIFGKQRKMVEK